MRPGKLLEESPRKPNQDGASNPFQPPVSESRPRGPQRVQRRRNYLQAYSKVRLGLALILFGYLLGFAFAAILIWVAVGSIQSSADADIFVVESSVYSLVLSMVCGVVVLIGFGLLITSPEPQEKRYGVLAMGANLASSALSLGAILEWPMLSFAGTAVGIVSTYFLIAFCTEVGRNIGSQSLISRSVKARQLLIASLVSGALMVGLAASIQPINSNSEPGLLHSMFGLSLLAFAVVVFALIVFQVLMLVKGITKLGSR